MSCGKRRLFLGLGFHECGLFAIVLTDLAFLAVDYVCLYPGGELVSLHPPLKFDKA